MDTSPGGQESHWHWPVSAMVCPQDQSSAHPPAGTAGALPVLGSALAPHPNTNIKGLECVQGRAKGLEHQKQLRELGKGLSLEKRRLGRALLALHNS